MAIENLEFRINAAVEAGNSAKTLGDLKASLKDLRDLAAEVGPDNVEAFNNISLAAGNVNDKVKDVRESVQALSGTPMERLGNSFSRLKQSIFEMDLDKFKQSLIGIKDSFIALGGQALSPFKNLGVAMAGLVTGTTSLTAAMRALGGAIAATGIGLLVVSIGLMVAYFDELKDSGGIIGGIFTTVSDTISSATNSLKEFARWLGLIGTAQTNNSEQAKKDAENLKKYTDSKLSDLEKAYQTEKKLRESLRAPGGDADKYRKEDLEKEKKYQEDRIKILEESNKSVLSIYDAYNLSAKKVKENEERLRLAKERGDKLFNIRYTIGTAKDVLDYEKAQEETKRIQKEYNDELNRSNVLLSELKAKQPFMGTSKDEIEAAKVEVEALSNQLNVLSKTPKKVPVKTAAPKATPKKGEPGFSELDFLEKYFETEENFLKQSVDLQEKYNKESSEIDQMYYDISMEGEIQKSENIFQEIDRRLEYQKSAAETASEIDREAAEEMEQWALQYASVRVASNLEMTDEIIKTAQYGAQSLDGLNQLLYTLDENRMKQGEMSEKSMAQRAFNRNKSLGIVNAAINTAAGVTAVLASPTNKIDPTGTLQAIQIGFVIATGLAQIATIASQRFDANSFSSGGGNNNITAPSEQATVDTGQFLDTGEFKAGDPRERRVYVVESDITGIQRKVQVIENRSKF